MNSDNNPLRQMPLDLMFLVFGTVPTIAIVILSHELMNLRGVPWLAGYFGAVILALSGSALLLRAKWPLYRQGEFFTLGAAKGRSAVYRRGIWLSGIGCGVAALLVLQSFIWR